jgi:lysophospholipase L1-like esterase
VNAPRPTVAIALVVTLAGSLLAACASEPESSAPLPTLGLGTGAIEIDVGGAVDGRADTSDQVSRVVMVGDSITKGSLPLLEQRFAALGLQPTIAAENGKRMAISSPNNPSGANVAEFLAFDQERDPATEVWVVALGTNDAGQYGSPDEIAAAVNEVLAEVPADAALVWVDTYIANRTDDTDEINDIIRQRVEERGNAVIAPWTSVADTDGVLTGDAVHPTSEGSEAFAAIVVETVRSFLGR